MRERNETLQPNAVLQQLGEAPQRRVELRPGNSKKIQLLEHLEPTQMSHHRVITHRIEDLRHRLVTAATADHPVAVGRLARVLRVEVAVHLLQEEGKNPA